MKSTSKREFDAWKNFILRFVARGFAFMHSAQCTHNNNLCVWYMNEYISGDTDATDYTNDDYNDDDEVQFISTNLIQLVNYTAA